MGMTFHPTSGPGQGTEPVAVPRRVPRVLGPNRLPWQRALSAGWSDPDATAWTSPGETTRWRIPRSLIDGSVFIATMNGTVQTSAATPYGRVLGRISCPAPTSALSGEGQTTARLNAGQ
jgi:hypothetical protein